MMIQARVLWLKAEYLSIQCSREGFALLRAKAGEGHGGGNFFGKCGR